jgi:hypothetical protein
MGGYCITSSARSSTDCGIVRPSALAVVRLIAPRPACVHIDNADVTA